MSKSPIRSVKGTQDILPDQSSRWQDLELTIQKIMDRYGYKEIRTPAFENTEVFLRGVGQETDIVSKEMYSWTDQGGNNLTLKPELTAPVVRSFIQHNLGQINSINKLYYIDSLFRRERPQKGRYREFHQFGVEVFGSEYPEVDVEVIALAMYVFNNMGLENLTLNLNSIGSPECRKNYRDAIKDFLEPHFDDLSKTSQDRYNNNPLRILDSKSPDEKELLKGAPDISDYWTSDDKSHFDEVCNLLKKIKIDYQLSPNLVRGLDYYTRTTFEITSNELGAQNAICGGGRYDELVENLGGKPTPGIGFAAGIERLLLASRSEHKPENIQIYIVGIGDSVRATLITLAENLRKNNFKTSFDYLRRSMKAQMREANKLGARYAIILGEDELKDKSVIIKDLSTSDQEKIALDLVEKHMKSLPL
jgi:histidyl-tRNA synthetase